MVNNSKYSLLFGVLCAIFCIIKIDNILLGIFCAIVCILGSIVLGICLLVYGSKHKKDANSKSHNSLHTLHNGMSSIQARAIEENRNELAKELKILIVSTCPLSDIDSFLIKREHSETSRSIIVSKAINLSMGELSQSEDFILDNEKFINELSKRYSITENELVRLPNYWEYMKLLQVQDLLQGNVPKRFSTVSSPINLQKYETPIWEFNKATLYEEQTTKTMVGRSSGFSIRIAKGVYYRSGSFKGKPVITTRLVPKYIGAMVVTDKHIYFYSPGKSIRFPFTKIVSFVPFEDGLGIQQDKQNAKPIYIQNIDGRLAYNIVSNIGNIK